MKRKTKTKFIKKYIVPGTKLGRLTVYLCLAFWVLMAVFTGFVRAGYRGGDTFFSNPPLFIPIVLAGLCGISSFFTGGISFLKQKERSLVVFLCLFLGAFVIVFISGEILTPH